MCVGVPYAADIEQKAERIAELDRQLAKLRAVKAVQVEHIRLISPGG